MKHSEDEADAEFEDRMRGMLEDANRCMHCGSLTNEDCYKLLRRCKNPECGRYRYRRELLGKGDDFTPFYDIRDPEGPHRNLPIKNQMTFEELHSE